MTTRIFNWLRRTRTPTSPRPARRAPVLGLERLDDRLAPVVGAFTIPGQEPGGALSGVVEITRNGQSHCSGTLLTGGRHVLSAAHCFADDIDLTTLTADFAVKFHLATASGGTREVTIPVAYASLRNYVPGSETDPTLPENDIAVLTLAALAPSGPGGATRHDVYRGTDEVGRLFRLAGYGDSGIGAEGSDPDDPLHVKRSGNNRFDATAAPLNDELQVVQVTGATGGTFRLGVGGAYTTSLAHNASAAAVQAALEGVTGNGNVAVKSPAGFSSLWYVRFQGGRGGLAVDKMGITASLTGAGATAGVFERVQGGGITGADTRLVADFDDGTAGHDAFGFLYGVADLGHGVKEAVGAGGDSGGPGLIGTAVAGVISTGVTTGFIPDVDWDVNFSFGEFEVFTRVSGYADWIDGIVNAPGELVIDMLDQPFLGDTTAADTITARRAGTNLEVLVDGTVIHSWPLSGVTGLRIEGDLAEETFVVGSGLGIPVAVAGNGGFDTLVAPDATNAWRITPGTNPLLDGTTGGHVSGSVNGSLTYQHMRYLQGGSGADTFRFDPTTLASTSSALFGIAGGGGIDTLDYSNAAIAVTANLAAGTATWVASGTPGLSLGATGIENLTGGPGRDNLTGDGGPNILLGGAGGDRLNGGAGRDLLIGGTGADMLTGGEDDDLLIAGTTAYDVVPTSLALVMKTWTSTDTYQVRISALRNGVGSGGSIELTDKTVLHDADIDTLRGDTGADWFWATTVATLQFPRDSTDLATGEQIN